MANFYIGTRDDWGRQIRTAHNGASVTDPLLWPDRIQVINIKGEEGDDTDGSGEEGHFLPSPSTWEAGGSLDPIPMVPP